MGTPDQSGQNKTLPIVKRALDAIQTVEAAAGVILPNPRQFVESLGAIVSTDNGRYDVLTNPQARDFAQANGWQSKAPDTVKDAARGSPVFYNPEDGNYYSPDKAGHRADNAWKAFDRKGDRIGTFVWDGNSMVKIGR
jgi:filamentous hemagglutinin